MEDEKGDITMKERYVRVGLVLLSLLYFQSAHAMTLCNPAEEIIWSCSSKNNIYSVCASKDLSINAGYMQYRAAKKGKTVFKYPEETKSHPSTLFHFALLAKGAMLSFNNNEYKYELFEGLMGEPSIMVSKNGKTIQDIQCEAGSDTLTLTPIQKILAGAGIKE